MSNNRKRNMKVDYSFYLVTDSSPEILGDRDLVQVVKSAIQGGVTIVQYRDKKSETAHLIRTAKRLHEITSSYLVPLLINDRIDVALAIGAEGVHIGQEDMDLSTARELLGPEAIIGVTASSVQEALTAAENGASYLGIGTVYATPTKTDTKSIIGTDGVNQILDQLSFIRYDIPTVAIGGLNAKNLLAVMLECSSSTKRLSGAAVVSAVMAATHPLEAAKELSTVLRSAESAFPPESSKTRELLSMVPTIIQRVGHHSPLCHNMTNLVVQNFAANVAICIGTSPIMANYGEEARDLANLGGALVVNMGTVTPDGLTNYSKAIRAYNAVGGPVLFDPVGGGATAIRREAVDFLMKEGRFDVIKGNENEILTVLGQGSVQQKGVDSGSSTSSAENKADVVRRLAKQRNNIVLMTGKTDFISDGRRVYAINNGHKYLGSITGSGCTLGTTIAAFLAVEREHKFWAAIAGILMFEIAAEIAGAREDVKGPGTFVPAFLDSLYTIAEWAKKDEWGWLEKIRIVEMPHFH
ncbi:MAG: thiamine biosynthetic bifunctional enzyme [Ramalina farinacea]|uniref:Thiamine biosynthetic bifunctional enzyme n=1 Tax=Ramalina farinacea TaxID=258253 RepID=A0AA43QQF9_9LECA|nr:thiamine biosynthetic bifunctional enzyme [Ramalina farinacea]